MDVSKERRYTGKTVVVKVGSGVLFPEGLGWPDEEAVYHIVHQVDHLRQDKAMSVLLVVSGAAANGAMHFKLESEISRRLATSFGWVHLAKRLDVAFKLRGILIAPMLIAADEEKGIWRKKDVLRLFEEAFKRGVVPVVNEFDAMHLHCFGGNDILAARVAILVGANQVLILSTPEGSPNGVGGMETKEQALAMLRRRGIEASIVDGTQESAILQNVR